MVSDLQKRTALAIVNIFETGRPQGDYGRVTVLAGDPGHLTYGRSQTTLASGNLWLLIKDYCERPDGRHGSALAGFLPALAARDAALDHDAGLHAVLAAAGADLVMQAVQDAFFDRLYWRPAQAAAAAAGWRSALAVAVVYDGHVHGAWQRLRAQTQAAHAGAGERAWIAGYVRCRRDWLAGHANPLLRRTTYRMAAFERLIAAGRWGLALPLAVRGVMLTEEVLAPALTVSAEADPVPPLHATAPPMRGEAVRALQHRLAAAGAGLAADGVFGAATDRALRRFQQDHGLKPDGILGPASRAALGLDG